jgi:hypothetical protein
MEFVGTGEFIRGLQSSPFDKLPRQAGAGRAGSAGLISAEPFSSDSAQASLASLAWTTQGWLCLFLGRPASLLAAKCASYSK